jgi:glutathione synthase/RimK-type ligase-like ATP-grasp enzyme
MIKVAIIHYVAGISSKILAEALRNNGVEADVFRLGVDIYDRDFRNYSHVFSYGCSAPTVHNVRINSAKSVASCVNKPSTFDALKKAGAATVEYTTKKPIPKHWDWVVIRDKVDGRKAEGLHYHENNAEVPDGVLYSEYFEHKYEYRIMVFKDEIVGRYFKSEYEGDWYFNNQPKRAFEEMDKHCLLAAKALGIDYVGFDVVANNKKDFRILEANSAPRITDEAEKAIVEYFINL